MKLHLKTRLLLLNVAVMGIFSVLVVVFVYFLAAHRMRQETEAFLEDEFAEYMNDYHPLFDDHKAAETAMQRHFLGTRRAYPVVCRLFDESGQVVSHTKNLPGVAAVDPNVVRRALGGERVRFELGPDGEGNVYWCLIQGATSPKGRRVAFEFGVNAKRLEESIAELRLGLLTAVPVVLLLSLAAAWLLTNSSLRPFGQLVASLRKIRSSSLNERLPVGNGSDELGTLAVAVNEMLAEVERAFSLTQEFTADAAHELRTPLARLTMLLEGSLGKELTEQEARSILDEAYEECVRLRRLVDDLMLLARLDAGEVEAEPTQFDVAGVIEDIRELWEDAAQERGIRMEVHVQGATAMSGHPALIRRLLGNLVGNGLRHALAEGHVRVAVAGDPRSLYIEVSDTGPGIPLQKRESIFRRFYRGDRSRNASTGGAGLGLSICRKIVDLHGGRIEADERQGGGATFRVTMPRNREEIPPASRGVRR